MNYDGRPLAGYIYIEGNLTNIEINKMNAERYYTMIFLHELTHILIFDKELLRMNNNFQFIENVSILYKLLKMFGCFKVVKLV